jgi:hypothetical protein
VIPFVGIVAQAFKTRDDVFGKPVGAVFGKFAVGTPPVGSTGLNLPLLARAIRLVVGWKFLGRTWPHPLFDRASGRPTYPITTLSTAERDALRRLCGPRPAAAA